ncbi:hypothetical protein MRX96_019065 [Rhipicephalus microplus]
MREIGVRGRPSPPMAASQLSVSEWSRATVPARGGRIGPPACHLHARSASGRRAALTVRTVRLAHSPALGPHSSDAARRTPDSELPAGGNKSTWRQNTSALAYVVWNIP